MTSATLSRSVIQSKGSIDWYRAVWRWHFYAGLFVLPFAILLAVTGGIYLFKDELNDTMYRNERVVQAQSVPFKAPSELAASALWAHPGALKAYGPPAAPDRAAEVKITGEDGLKDTVYVNPYSGEVLGSLWDGGAAGSPVMWTIRKLHSLELVGWVGNWINEAVAGWMIILTVTGVYLWWPRGRNVGVVTVKARKGRPFWRDLHAVTGIFVSGFILFLALSGLPWSSFWGSKFYDFSYAAGLGMPDGYWGSYPVSTVPVADAIDRAPWIMEKQPMPVSQATEGVPAKLDDVVKTVDGLGIHPGYALDFPSDPTGVFTASVYPDDVSQERVVHLDQYSGQVLFDMKLEELGFFGKIAEWGVGIHMGQAFGLANQIVLLLACAAILVMSVSGGAMWWKRRPAKSIGVPPMPSNPKALWVLVFLMIVGGVIFPLTGLTLMVMLVIDLAVIFVGRHRRSSRQRLV